MYNKKVLKVRPKSQNLPGQMNKTERFYRDFHLEPLKCAGQILSYGYECITLTLAHNTPGGKNSVTYKPDFFVVLPDRMRFVEIKAKHKDWTSMRDDALVKLKLACELYPMFEFALVLIDMKSREVTEQILN